MSNAIGLHDGGMLYLTLDGALADIAQRTFYEDATVTPLLRAGETPATCTQPVAWLVEDESGAHMSDDWQWTYGEGIHDTDSVSEVSRLHDPAEHYATAAHIRFNMSHSVEALEDGVPVTFAYVVVNDASVTYDDDGNAYDEDGELTDDIAGWALAAMEHN